MLKVNGRKVAAILHTGCPISIIPKSYKKLVRPQRGIMRQTARKFVDANGRPIPINNRYKLETELNGIEKPIVRWKVETTTKPIIGMDNFDKLGLQLVQRPPNGTKYVNSGKGNQVRRVTKQANM